ncbi:MAG: AAA family ATPase [Ferrovum myxofaciens]|uniref:ParA family partition ATPase n=1 Tax=Ferrovum myxofaciens TaxID=416213 RepID=UPI0023573AC9|nr:ParA family partition ATPase [Ferrovum myxofaciens]QKE41209.1 MAG: AAA family ATPase [Ferrovum myxofaciens]
MADRIIAVINQKGGTGKTTLALNLAAGLALRGSTHLVDADPQRSVSQWVGMGAECACLPPVLVIGSDPVTTLAKLARSHRYVVVDCPPAVQGPIIEAVMASADLVLIPVLPSPIDLWASVDMVTLVSRAQQKNRALQACLVLNQVETRNALSRAMHEAVAEFDMPALQAGMQRRAAYRSAAVEGTSVYGLGKRAQTAVADIEAIIEEVLCL